ncbi:reverse transcriptase domain-containing protein [Tanacetum coccineum]|uniref:Reverse transcriptase domain-containing protein n=1 Tax=Tanacetum coccineum TaxID=301880 RepID=A0ABQ5I322_9ASTR
MRRIQRRLIRRIQDIDSSIGAKVMGFGRRIRAIEATQGFYGVTSPQEHTVGGNEDVALLMFPLSLTGEAKAGLDELNKGTIKTWDELQTAFISRFFPPALFDLLLREIRAFSQHENESLTDAWLHMKEMLKNCHGHNLSKGNIINFFYHVLNEITQEVLNAAAGGILLYKTPNQAYQLLEDKVLLKLDWAKNQKNQIILLRKLLLSTMKKQKHGWTTSTKELSKLGMNFELLSLADSFPQLFLTDSSKEIRLFLTMINESLNDAWLLMEGKCSGLIAHGHNLSKGNIINFFYHVLNEITQEVLNAAAGGNSNSDTDKIMAQMDAMTIKMDAQYKELQSHAKQPTSDLDDDDIPMSREEEAKFMQTFSDLGARIKPMSYSLYAKLSLETLQPTKISVRLVDRSFQYLVRIAENMLVEVDKFTFPADFVILEMEEDSKVSLILGQPFLPMYINVIDEILEEDFDALLDEGSKILHSIEGTILEEEIFFKIDKFIAMAINENYDSESDEEELKFEKITINTDYKIKTSLKEPPTDLKLKSLPDNLEYVFLEEPSFLPVIISSQLSAQNKSKLVSVLKKHKEAFAWKTTNILGICPSFCKHKIQLLDKKSQLSKNREATFQRCMLAIFHDMIEESVKVFMDDFSIFGNSFNKCLNNLDRMLHRCKDAHHVLNWEKCHFMVKEGIVLRHKVSGAGLEVDKAKIDKQDAKPHLIRWILLLQEFDIEIKDKKGIENVAADHLFQIENDKTSDDSEVDENFLEKPLWKLNRDETWFADFAKLLVEWPKLLIKQQRGQVENTNRASKEFLKGSVKDNPTMWSRNLCCLCGLALCIQTPNWVSTPYKIVYGKNYHLSFEIEHRAYWALKNCNPDLIVAGEK